MPRLKAKKYSRRKVFCSQRDYPSVRATLGFTTYIDTYLDDGMIYAVWPNRAQRWYSMKRQVLIFKKLED